MKKKDFSIAFSGLKLGKHEFKYEIGNEFFEAFECFEFNSAAIDTLVILNKTDTFLELEMLSSGSVNVQCDVSDEAFDQILKAEMKLVVNFGETFNDDNIDVLIIPRSDFQVNFSQYLYESLVLAVPVKRVHPGVLDGSLDSETVKRLEALQPQEQINNNEQNDPRWDALKNLITDK